MSQNQEEIIAKIHQALDEIRPFLKSDGGDISFVSLKDEKQKELIENNNNIKICAGEKSVTLKNYDEY